MRELHGVADGLKISSELKRYALLFDKIYMLRLQHILNGRYSTLISEEAIAELNFLRDREFVCSAPALPSEIEDSVKQIAEQYYGAADAGVIIEHLRGIYKNKPKKKEYTEQEAVEILSQVEDEIYDYDARLVCATMPTSIDVVPICKRDLPAHLDKGQIGSNRTHVVACCF
jgi:hypothetical protein